MFLLEAVFHHTIAKDFNFVGDSVPQGPLAYGLWGVRAYGKSVLKNEVHADAPSGQGD